MPEVRPPSGCFRSSTKFTRIVTLFGPAETDAAAPRSDCGSRPHAAVEHGDHAAAVLFDRRVGRVRVPAGVEPRCERARVALAAVSHRSVGRTGRVRRRGRSGSLRSSSPGLSPSPSPMKSTGIDRSPACSWNSIGGPAGQHGKRRDDVVERDRDHEAADEPLADALGAPEARRARALVGAGVRRRRVRRGRCGRGRAVREHARVSFTHAPSP